jgi:hypothetical protein
MFEHSGHYRFSEEAPLFLKTVEEFLKQSRWTAWGKFTDAATVSILIYCSNTFQHARFANFNAESLLDFPRKERPRVANIKHLLDILNCRSDSVRFPGREPANRDAHRLNSFGTNSPTNFAGA